MEGVEGQVVLAGPEHGAAGAQDHVFAHHDLVGVDHRGGVLGREPPE